VIFTSIPPQGRILDPPSAGADDGAWGSDQITAVYTLQASSPMENAITTAAGNGLLCGSGPTGTPIINLGSQWH